MKRRDIVPRAAGAALVAACCLGARSGLGGPAAVFMCVLGSVLGLVLLINGRRMLTVLRAEIGGHAPTSRAVGDGRPHRGGAATTGNER